jgi:hypothetical protein
MPSESASPPEPNMRINAPQLMLAAALCCIACWGCGLRSGPVTGLIPVKGRVTHKGAPVQKGEVTFVPDGYGREARGRIQPDGSFVLTTDKEGDGVVAGEHKVTITDLDKTLASDRAVMKYASPNTTTLTAGVDAEHTEFAFDLH